MNKHVAIILVIIFLTSLACKQDKQTREETGSRAILTSIEGVLLDGAGREVVLEEMAPREYIPVDTVNCNEKDQFDIKFEPSETAFYVLRIGPSGYITLLLEPGEKVIVNGSYGQPENYSLSGSEGSELLLKLALEHKKTLHELSEINRRNIELQHLPDYPELKGDLDWKFDSVTQAFQDYSIRFIEENQESLSILIALYNLYGQGLPVFDPGHDFHTYKFVDSLLQARYPEYEVTKLLHAQVLEAEAGVGKIEQDQGPGLGEIAPDFVSSRPDGSRMALSDLKGNHVLLSFWAAWSTLSREENRYMKDVWKKYGMLDFKILQVSFDEEKENWTGAIEEENLSWDHVSDLQRWESAVADLYQIEKIPSNYLINPEGRIIAQDLFGSELLEKMNNLYSKN